jgi:hypothetical protein
MKMICLTGVLLAAAVLGACTTFAPVGRVEYQLNDDLGRPRSEYIVGLFAVPTPRRNTIVLIPLYKSYLFRGGAAALPEGAQRWLSQPPVPAPSTSQP